MNLFRIAAAVGLFATLSTPALAADTVHRHHAAFNPARCTMQQVHTPAGKLVHQGPIVRCRAASGQELASRDAGHAAPGTTVARD